MVAGTVPGAMVAALRGGVADLRDAVFLPGRGHWTQQERPAEANTALVDFVGALK
ncbi:hypothetical protein [Pseudonocardia sp. H11422]|uniref:hypothetical protein n=1 Tax=Pseudonocardia sp. H11422 TaxID=2835866 RepID=UPI001BDC1083|nr:hypothetical protein [Pseudonocardia sp. H11422]